MPAAPRTFYQVLRLYYHISERLEMCLQPEGLTAGQYTALSLLRRYEPTSSAELARRLQITAQSMGEFVRALETKGMVERETAPDNRRIVLLRLTGTGRQALQRCDRLVNKAESHFLSCLNANEAEAFQDAIGRLRRHNARTA